jgi:two-component system CitB family response regulator
VISVLVVDDDFRVAQVHAEFAERTPGFRVVGLAHTAAEARDRARALHPNLVLLDVYLPDAPGTSLLGQLGADVIVLTAAADVAAVRTALARGAMNYLIKPFTAEQLGERLAAYARYRALLSEHRALTQAEVDQAVAVLHEGDGVQPHAPKGQSPVTTRLVADILRRSSEPRSAAEIAVELGIARATAQRYLAALARTGRAAMTLRYGSTGRPEHLYSWRPAPR